MIPVLTEDGEQLFAEDSQRIIEIETGAPDNFIFIKSIFGILILQAETATD